jgi:hypothetical protein
VVALEFIVNRHDLAAKVGHLRVTCRLVTGELRHLVRVGMRDTGALSRVGAGNPDWWSAIGTAGGRPIAQSRRPGKT